MGIRGKEEAMENTISPSLKQVSNIHDECVGDGIYGNVFARLERVFDFEAAAIILKEHCEGTVM